LRNEQHHYNEKSGSYAKLTPEEAHRVLAERVGALASAEHSKWITAHREKVETPAGD
jgi:ribosome maturation factor RimP